MGSTAKRTDPGLWEKVKAEVEAGDKGGAAGQWSARKAQMAVQEYKRRGGGYEGGRRADNSLKQWQDEDWGTASGRRSRDTGERYLPREAREHLESEDYRRSSAKKRADSRTGRQHSPQPPDVARKTAPYRHGGRSHPAGAEPTKAELMAEARRRDIRGRSKMGKEELRHALGR
jgi:hypothetical protein